jgi:hypothetical protein
MIEAIDVPHVFSRYSDLTRFRYCTKSSSEVRKHAISAGDGVLGRVSLNENLVHSVAICDDNVTLHELKSVSDPVHVQMVNERTFERGDPRRGLASKRRPRAEVSSPLSSAMKWIPSPLSFSFHALTDDGRLSTDVHK